MPPKPKNKNKKNSIYDADVTEIVKKVITILTTILFVLVFLTAVIKTYNPKKKFFISRANYAYKKIQDELAPYYKKQGYVYTSQDEKTDEFCILLGKKYSKTYPDCRDNRGIPKTNFVFKGTKIEIIGMEKPPVKKGGTLVKDILIDTNGSGRGDDEIGSDRVPIRIYSSGRMGGLLSPLNCNHKDTIEFDIEYADICHNGPEIDFMTTNIPFGYDIFQIGGPKGQTKALNRDIPYLRADCSAFGGEMADLEDYCDRKGYYWTQSCYDEYECAVWISKTKL